MEQHMSQDYNFFQEGAKRLEEAMIGFPDRVPVYAQLHEFALKQLGVSARDFYSTPDLIVNGALEITKSFGIDVASADYDVYDIEAEAIGQELIWDDENMPGTHPINLLINGPEDLPKIRTPDFDSAGRCAMVIETHALFRKVTGLEPTLSFCAPFSLAAGIRGISQLIYDMLEAPDFARNLFDRLTEEVIAPWILYQKKYFPNATSIAGSDATASIPILNPSMIREWVIPYIQRLRELCGPEVCVPNWIGEWRLENPEEMLDLKLTVCPHFIEGQDPDVEELGPQLYKRYAEKRDVPLVLGVGAAFMAQRNIEDEVTARVKQYIEVGGQNGRFALYLCNLGATTPPENVRAAVSAVRAFGEYPLSKPESEGSAANVAPSADGGRASRRRRHPRKEN
jgi:uroporphyrinogen-III decarboxylase